MGISKSNVLSRTLKNNHGLSIIEVLVAAGIMAIIMGGFTSMIMHQNKETKAVTEMLASLDLQKTLVGALADGTVCGYVMNNPTSLPFDATALPYTITLPNNRPLYAGVSSGTPTMPIAAVDQAPSPLANSLVVKTIKLIINSGSGNKFYGQWVIEFDHTKSVRAHRPAIVSTVLTANTTIPGASTISGCMGAGLTAQSCAANELMRGFDNSGTIICDPVDSKFLKLDGSNAMTGNLNMGNRNIVGAGTVAFNQGEIIGTAVTGNPCAVNGAFTKIAGGSLVSCQSGTWKAAQAAVGKQVVANTIASFGNSSTVGGNLTINGAGLVTSGITPQCTLSNSTGNCIVGTCPTGSYGNSPCTIYTPTVDGLFIRRMTGGGCSMSGCSVIINDSLNSWSN